MNTKQANWADTLGSSAALGGGTFAIGALIQEIARQRSAEDQRKKQQLPNNALVIDLPRLSQKKAEDSSAFLKQADGLLANTLAVLAGAPAGYLGAKSLYDGYKKKQSDKEISDANLKYMQTLQMLQQKTAALNTPLVDQLCKAAAEQLEKQSFNFSSLGKAVPLVAGGAFGGMAANDLGWLDSLKKNPAPPTSGVLGDVWNGGKDAWTTLAVLTALGGAGAMIHANNKKVNREGAAIPSAVALNYEDIPPAASLGR